MFMTFSADCVAGTSATTIQSSSEWRRSKFRRRLSPTPNGGAELLEKPALYTATLAWTDRHGTALHAFYAVIAESDAAAVHRLEDRLGGLSAHLHVRRGFDPAHPLAISLLAEAVSDMLLLVDAAPESPLARGLDLLVEQRFLP